MTTTKTIKILDSWILPGKGMVVELQHNTIGLPQGTRLTSKKTGQKWKVKSRLIFKHTADRQKKFSTETEKLIHLSFNPIDNLEKSKMDILYKEGQGIYQYHLDPYGHNEKPTTGDKLDIEKE